MLSKRTTLAVLCAAALVACDAADSVTGPTEPSLMGGGPVPPIEEPPVIKPPVPPVEEFLPGLPVLDPFALIWKDHDGVVESARGFGHFHVSGALRTFAFVARNHADGTTDGQYQIDNRSTGIKEAGVVSCLEVVGNSAWIGGTVTHSSDPLRVGLQRTFRVVDRGDGSPPDLASLAEFRPAEACHLMLADELHELEGGDIRVRDGA
jgi:hypothetical protein